MAIGEYQYKKAEQIILLTFPKQTIFVRRLIKININKTKVTIHLHAVRMIAGGGAP